MQSQTQRPELQVMDVQKIPMKPPLTSSKTQTANATSSPIAIPIATTAADVSTDESQSNSHQGHDHDTTSASASASMSIYTSTQMHLPLHAMDENDVNDNVEKINDRSRSSTLSSSATGTPTPMTMNMPGTGTGARTGTGTANSTGEVEAEASSSVQDLIQVQKQPLHVQLQITNVHRDQGRTGSTTVSASGVGLLSSPSFTGYRSCTDKSADAAVSDLTFTSTGTCISENDHHIDAQTNINTGASASANSISIHLQNGARNGNKNGKGNSNGASLMKEHQKQNHDHGSKLNVGNDAATASFGLGMACNKKEGQNGKKQNMNIGPGSMIRKISASPSSSADIVCNENDSSPHHHHPIKHTGTGTGTDYGNGANAESDDHSKTVPNTKLGSGSKTANIATETATSIPGATSTLAIGKHTQKAELQSQPSGSNKNGELCTNLPISFEVDVASALDQVLYDLNRKHTPPPNNLRGSGSGAGSGSGSVGNKQGSISRPCVLQQTSVVDISPCSSPNEEGSVEDGSIVGNGSSISGNGSVTGTGSVGDSSVRVKSSMLVCEESLNMIAQMTAPAKEPQQQSQAQISSKTLSLLQPVTIAGSGIATGGTIGASIPMSTSTTASASTSISPTVTKIGLEKQTTKIKCISGVTAGENTARKIPLITGTAAAQFDAIARKHGGSPGKASGIGNAGLAAAMPAQPAAMQPQIQMPNSTNVVSKPLAPPPQLGLQLNALKQVSISGTPNANQAKANGIPIASVVPRDQQGVNVSLGVKKTGEGMDMLAEIISHAVPIPGGDLGAQQNSLQLQVERNVQQAEYLQQQKQKQKQDQEQHQNQQKQKPLQALKKKDNDSDMVPIGQSLSVYSAIAAQAGITTHRPVPLPVQQPQQGQVQIQSQAQSHEKASSQLQPQSQPQLQPQPQPQPQPQHQAPPQQIMTQENPAPPKTTYVREIGKIRRYNANTQEFSDWEDLPCQTYGDTEPRRWSELNIDESIEIPLKRGGRLRVFPNFVAEGRRMRVADSLDRCTLYRQYHRQGNEHAAESRVQVLLSSKTNRLHNGSCKRGRPGYQYDGVTMMAQPLAHVPQVERLGQDLAELYRLPEKEWNIGANLVCYRTGEDHMAWNSNCEQGEVLILCVIAESRNCTRPILIRPKGHDPMQDGDEEIIVFVGQGDAYEMDGQMQLSYEHCMPKKEDDMSAKRSVVLFRHGRSVSVTFDTGRPLFSDQSTSVSSGRVSSVRHGHPIREISEGKEVFTREQIVQAGAHTHASKSIHGTLRDGCDSILIESQDALLREDDGLCWLQVTSSKADGGGYLSQSYISKNPVRVFRSSSLESRYAPALYEDEADKTLYRYDGLYAVRAMWDSEGEETDNPPPNDGSKNTFFLTRFPKSPVDGYFEEDLHYNKISIHELWTEIQKRNGVRKPRPFQVPQPFMELGPIGDKSVLSRKRKENIKLPSEENLKMRRARQRLKNASSPDENILSNDYRTRQQLSRRLRSSAGSANSDSEAENELVEEQIRSEDESDATSTSRPKRASAAAARSYLQEAMQNKYGVGEKGRPTRKRRPSICIDNQDDTRHSKRLKDDDSSSSEHSAMSDDDFNSMSDHGADRDEPMESSPIAVKTKNDYDQIKEESPCSVPIKKESKPKPIQKEPAKRANRRKQVKQTETKAADEVKDSTLQHKDETEDENSSLNPSSIQVGYRINVEYKNVLYKATVKRIRIKADESHEYQIHYDGNKKTNLRWIQSSMISSIISKSVEPEEVKSSTARKERKVAKPAESEVVVKEETEPEKKEAEAVDEMEKFKFKLSSEIYVEYRKVLYVSTIRKLRLNRKGNCEYLVHYDGFKKTADRWVKEDALHEINDESTLRFNEQRGDASIGNQAGKTNKKPQGSVTVSLTVETEITTRRCTSRGRSINRRNLALEDENTLDMGDHDAGVEFLPGSSVFVVRKDALYLAQMVKRKKIDSVMSYLVHFDGSSSKHDTWMPLSTVYEINPKTRRIFEATASKRESLHDEDEEDNSPDEKETPAEKISPTRPSSRRATRKPAKYGQEDDEDEVEKPVKNAARNKKTSTSKTSKDVVLKPVDMSGIDSGCEFLPGSTVFVVWRNGLYLAKMLKRRGKGDRKEYFVHYDGFKQSQDAWVSVSMVYEINPQTKRAFNKQKK